MDPTKLGQQTRSEKLMEQQHPGGDQLILSSGMLMTATYLCKEKEELVGLKASETDFTHLHSTIRGSI